MRKLFCIVSAHHAATGREKDRLDDDRIIQLRGELARVCIEREGLIARLAHAGAAQHVAHQVLVLGRSRGARRVVTQPKLIGNGRSRNRRVFVHRDDSINRMLGGVCGGLARGLVGIIEVERQQAFRVARR